MRYLYALAIIVMLTACTTTAPPITPTTTAPSVQLTSQQLIAQKQKANSLCMYHGGMLRFGTIDAEHFYTVCADQKYYVISYNVVDSFTLNFINNN